MRFVQRLNSGKLGNAADLGTFLFGQERASLDAYRPILLDVQKGACLYCKKPLSGPTQVDHFVPWSRYPADLGHNFVLAHDRCNNAKSDHLAAEDHIAAWVGRNDEHRAELHDRLIGAGLPCDPTATVQIARWVYQQTEKVERAGVGGREGSEAPRPRLVAVSRPVRDGVRLARDLSDGVFMRGDSYTEGPHPRRNPGARLPHPPQQGGQIVLELLSPGVELGGPIRDPSGRF